MPPLLSPSPAILDQSFPKAKAHLDSVYESLGEMELLLSENKIHIILSDALAEWVLDYDWAPPENCLRLDEIFRFINNLFLSPKEGLIRLCLDPLDCEEEEFHPLREDYEGIGKSELWSIEMGKLLKLHNSIRKQSEYFIGIACEYGFSGKDTKKISGDICDKSFPIVGINEISILDDAYTWTTEAGILQREVSFSQAKKNIHMLGATKITNPKGGSSHYPVHFNKGRTWPLDSNDDPVPLVYMRNLVPITGYPIDVIVHVLLFGEFPLKRLKIPDCYVL